MAKKNKKLLFEDEKSIVNPETGQSHFVNIPHHGEMYRNSRVTNDAPHAYVINLADIEAMTDALEAVETIDYKPLY